jgi:hypothetical protein
MTDRINMLQVVLEKDIRIDDAQPLVEAIKQMKNVLDVKVNISSPSSVLVAETRIKNQIAKELMKVLYNVEP